MAAVKFVHVLKKIENLNRDISEIHALQNEINPDRDYSTPLKISLEQQVNTLLNEKTKLMEVRLDNAQESLNLDKKKAVAGIITAGKPAASFDSLERQYYEFLRYKRSNYEKESSYSQPLHSESLLPEKIEKIEKKESKNLPSLAEKSLHKPDGREDDKSFLKRREDILKNLPPLEY